MTEEGDLLVFRMRMEKFLEELPPEDKAAVKNYIVATLDGKKRPRLTLKQFKHLARLTSLLHNFAGDKN